MDVPLRWRDAESPTAVDRSAPVAVSGAVPKAAAIPILSGSCVTFTWTAGAGALAYWLDVGTVQGQGDISAGQLSASTTSVTVNGIPTAGATIYVRRWTL